MKLVVLDGGIAIYHGDGEGFALSNDLTGDVVIADLPYGAGSYKTDVAFQPETIAKLLTAKTCALFGWPEALAALCAEQSMLRGEVLRPDEWITWWSPNKCDPRAKDLREAEAIAIFGEVPGRARIRRPRSRACRDAMERYPGKSRARISNGPLDSAQDGSVWPINAPGIGFNAAKRLHENEKPLELMERLVLLCSEPGDTIVDPCCGSGTTLLAARNLGRMATGLDTVEEHCVTASKRLRQQVLPGVAS